MRRRLLADPDAHADYEILEMLLFLGISWRNTKPFAKGLINRFGSLAAVMMASPEELESAGLNAESITALKIVVDVADQLAAAESIDRPVLNNLDRLVA
jgi:DNA repair protein RadC